MSASATPPAALLPVTLLLRQDLTLALCTQEGALELPLTPQQALELAVDLIDTALAGLSPSELRDAGCELISKATQMEKANNRARIENR
jgi:hypothetical protein